MKKFLFWQQYDSTVWILFFSRIVVVMGYAIAIPFLSLYLHGQIGISIKIIGAIMAVTSAIGAISQMAGGELSDYFGRKKIMILALSGRTVAFILFAYLVAIGADIYVMSLLLLFNSIIGSLTLPASNAMIADVVSPKKRIEAFALMRTGTNIGWAIGPLIGAVLADISYSALFLFTSLTSLIAGLLILFMVKEGTSLKDFQKFVWYDIFKVKSDYLFLLFCFSSFMIWVLRGQLGIPVSIFTVERVGISKIQLGYLYTINGLIVVFFQYPVAILAKSFALTSSLITGCIFLWSRLFFAWIL